MVESPDADLEGAIADTGMEPISLEAAEVESGYTRAHLRRLLREGSLPNAGTKSSPTILRMHLPKKPGFGVAQTHPRATSSQMQVARTVALGEE